MFRPIRMDHTNCLQVAIKTLQFEACPHLGDVSEFNAVTAQLVICVAKRRKQEEIVKLSWITSDAEYYACSIYRQTSLQSTMIEPQQAGHELREKRLIPGCEFLE
jgi:hypothetical protein